MGKLLRKYGKREFEIQDMISKLDVDKNEMTYDEFRDWVYGVYGDDDPIKEYAKKLDEQAAEAEE
jgi:hypothetical protein